MKKLIAVLLAVLLVVCVAGCNKKPTEDSSGEPTTSSETAKRTTPLKYGINAHIYEQRVMDPAATMDYVTDMVSVLGVEYYRLNTTFDGMFTVTEGDTLVFKDGFKNLVHQIIEKMTAGGITHFVAVTDSMVYPYGYEVTCVGSVPDPAVEKDMYIRWVKLYAKAWGMIAAEFPEITHFECMNEPDLPGANTLTKQGHLWATDDGYVYSLTDKAHMIADLLYYIHKEVKAVNPKAIVTTPGLAIYGEGKDFLDYIYEAIESGAHPFDQEEADTDPDHYFDEINFHKYLSGFTVESYVEYLDDVYNATERHNDRGKPAILTEWGFTDNDSEAQEIKNGEDMRAQLESFDEKMPYLEAALVYVLNDLKGFSVNSSEDNFGLFSSPGDPEKPSCPKPAAIEFYKYIHKTEDVSPLYKYCPELMPQ